MAYLCGIKQIVKKNQDNADAEYQAAKASFEKRAEELNKADMAALLTKLRTGANANPGNRLDPDEPAETTIYPYILGSSPASARLVQQLYQDGLIKEWPRSLSLLWTQPGICHEWLTLIEAAATASPNDKKLAEFAEKLLYSNGFKQDRYRPLLLKRAVEMHDVRSLELLFFSRNAITGRLQANVTIENLALARQLSGKGQPLNIRLACAHFATEVYNYSLAEEICLSILRQDYRCVLQGPNNKLSKEDDEADSALLHARQAALTLGFYGIRSEPIFQEVFRLATLNSPDASSIPAIPGATPPNAQTLFHSLSRFDCGYAHGLLLRVRELLTKGASDLSDDLTPDTSDPINPPE
ncbi:MAG: hypothetical protein WC789_05820 [Lentisphaeria bacterium]